MKKSMSLFLVMLLLIVFLPLNVRANVSIVKPIMDHCTENGDEVDCEIFVNTDEPVDKLTFKVTEYNGAKIQEFQDGDDFGLVNPEPTPNTEGDDGSYIVEVAASTPLTGKKSAFKVQYKKSALTNCKVEVSLVNVGKDPNPDKPGENKKTGSTLPFVALGAMLFVSVGAYAYIRNKAKMYKL